MEKFAQVLNETPDASIRVPSTRYKIKKLIKPEFSTEIHMKCNQCLKFTGAEKNETECVNCGITLKTSDSTYFMYFPVKQQIGHNIALHIDEILEYCLKVLEENEITDIHNASIFKNLQKKYPNHKILPLVVNTDGAKFFKSSNDSRSEFFEPFLKEMRSIIQSGGIQVEHNGEIHRFMPLIVSACCDLPAKSDVQGLTGHSGRFACGYCLHPGVPIKSATKTTIRYVNGEYELRNHTQFIDTYRIQTQMKFVNPTNGIRKLSCFIAVENFDMVYGFSIDHMHLELNMMRKMCDLWLDSSNHKQPCYIQKKTKFC